MSSNFRLVHIFCQNIVLKIKYLNYFKSHNKINNIFLKFEHC